MPVQGAARREVSLAGLAPEVHLVFPGRLAVNYPGNIIFVMCRS